MGYFDFDRQGPRGRRRARSILRDDDGIVLALFALSLPALLIASAIVVNFAGYSVNGRSGPGPFQELTAMQMAADAASRSAAILQVMEITDGTKATKVQNEALALAAANGYPTTDPSVAVEVNTSPNITMGNYMASGYNAVEVIISKQHPILFLSNFMNFFGWTSQPLKVRSVAAWNFAPCIVALSPDPTGQNGLKFAGQNTQIIAECGIYSNSTSSDAAIQASGTCGSNGPWVATYYAGMVGGSTGQNVTGICGITAGQNPIISSNMSPVVDPFSSLNLSDADAPKQNTPKDITAPLEPGLYSGNQTFSPTNVSSGTLTLNPGIYFFTGTVSFSSITVNAPGVTIVTEGASRGLSVGGSSTSFNLTAPTTGPSAGMAVVNTVDSASTPSNTVSFNSGSTSLNINGVIYSPKAPVTYNSPIQGTQNCLTIIGLNVTVAGGGTIGGACPAKMMNASGFRAAGLVE